MRADAFASFEAARELVSVLDELRLDAIATVDPTEPGAFVAALYFPRRQLWVVRASHPSVEELEERITLHRYRDVYSLLQATPRRDGKFFVQDAAADGILSASPGGAVDVLYEDGGRQTLFNGDLKGQGLTAAAYDEKLATTDEKYARLLALLTSAVHEMRR